MNRATADRFAPVSALTAAKEPLQALGGMLRHWNDAAMVNTSRKLVEDLMASAGVTINGASPSDIQVIDDRFFDELIRGGSLGLGESYVKGWWECSSLDGLFARLATVQKRPATDVGKYALKLRYAMLNMQSRSRATEVADAHYNLSNDLFRLMLDPYMQYSCAYWPDAQTLQQAQEAKLELICRKLHLQPGDRVLEIGCGWGGLAKYMASRYGCHVTAVNISTEQIKFAREFTRGLPVSIVESDYRDLKGSFDKVVSIAMFEAVGQKNFRTYMDVVHRLLKDDGIFLLHTIGDNVARTHGDRWILKYIFPNGHLPSIDQIGSAIERRFVMEDWHCFGPDYDRTLLAWDDNFRARWPEIQRLDSRFDQRFYRMWRYYLLNSAGSFRGRTLQLWQLAMTKYRSGTHYQRVAYK